MSDPILGQNEVNALLDAIKMGGLADDVDVAPGASAAVSYALTSNQRVVRGRMPALEIVNDRQARLHRGSLSAIARRVVDVSYRSTSLVRFGEVQANLPNPTCVSIVQISPLAGFAAVAFDTSMLYSILDILFGGPGSGHKKRAVGDLTAVEIRLSRRLVDAILADLERAWQPLLRVRGEFVRTESNPRFVTIAAPGDVMVEITYDYELERILTGTLSILIPYAALQPYRSRLSSVLAGEQTGERNEWLEAITEHVLDVEVEATGILGTTRLGLADILRLAPGDVLKLNTDAAAPVAITVERTPVAQGLPEVVGGNIALRLTEPVMGPRFKREKNKKV